MKTEQKSVRMWASEMMRLQAEELKAAGRQQLKPGRTLEPPGGGRRHSWRVSLSGGNTVAAPGNRESLSCCSGPRELCHGLTKQPGSCQAGSRLPVRGSGKSLRHHRRVVAAVAWSKHRAAETFREAGRRGGPQGRWPGPAGSGRRSPEGGRAPGEVGHQQRGAAGGLHVGWKALVQQLGLVA